MKTKQEVIAEAYGEYFEECNPDENGWTKWTDTSRFHSLEFDEKNDLMRPLSLKCIETNNNWVVIQSEADLPNSDIDCHIEFSDGSISTDRFFISNKNFKSNHWSHITAYRPIENPPKRIY